jgi:DNA-binding protein YbaB
MENAAGDWRRVRAELMDAMAQGKRFEAVARRKQIARTDRQEVVTATANAFGDIVDLAISEEALRHPQQLGEQVTEAVAKARQAGRALGERLRELHFPTVPALGDAIAEIPDSVRYDEIGYADSPEAKNAVAECGELLRRIADETDEFERKTLRVEIGTAAGHVETNVSESFLRARIRSEVPGKIGPARLARQILTAINGASEQAGRRRASVFGKALADSSARDTWRALGEERRR